MNQTQLIIMVATLVLLNFIWGLSSNKSDSDIQQSSTEVKLERSSTEITFYTVVLIIPLALCLWMTNIWFTAYNKSVQAADWEVISAKIIDKQVKTATISGNTVNNNVRGSNYIPYIEYEYTFKGIPYTSTTFSFFKTNRIL